MNKRKQKYFLLMTILVAWQSLYGQVFSNEMSFVDKVNVYKVVTFDEFVNRFNNDPKSNIKKAYKYYHAEFRIRRLALIKSLFDYETKTWDTTDINRFAAGAMDPVKSKLLTAGASLFAEARCRFRYNAAEVDVPLILRYDSDPARGSKWIICGVGDHGLALNNLQSPEIKEHNKAKFINPVNNEINFTDLERVFEDKANLPAYFEKGFFMKKRSIGFYNAVLQNQIQFLGVKDIQYHDLQYENWIFTVKEFRRNTLNSGWLINKLIKATPQEKDKYLKTLLGE